MEPNTLNLIKVIGGNSLHINSTGKDVLNGISMTEALKTIINKWELLKLYSFFTSKDTIILEKWQTTRWEKNLLPITHLIER